MSNVFLGIDVGSVSTNLVAIDKDGSVLHSSYIMTAGRPIDAVQKAVRGAEEPLAGHRVVGAGTTGSGRTLAAAMVGADVVKNEITAHAVAALAVEPRACTIIEIGGQDSKLIIINDGIVVDFAMNTVCAAGTGSFLDRQAARLDLPIEEFGRLALMSKSPVRIAGRCAVFAESDMVHKQQIGCKTEDIVRGLCQALVRNYLNNVAKGKNIMPPVLFQGGVAANEGMRRVFEEVLGCQVIVPEHHKVMGALGAAMLATHAKRTRFRGFEALHRSFTSQGFECDGCANACEVVALLMDGVTVARWGGRCGRWESVEAAGS
jgi:predicted CoA-substrate-specific enzyme activase